MIIGKNHLSTVVMKDISDYLRCQGIVIIDGNKDIWTVTPNTLFTKESRRLNRELGIHIVNKHAGNMSRK